MSLAGWFRKNFDPGIMSFLTDELRFSPAELREEYLLWREYNRHRTPDFFPGFIEVLKEFRAQGGIVAVVSHSEVANIQRHYRSVDFEPDLILGWDDDPSRRKPSPWPVIHVMESYDLEALEVLVIDDLKPGVTMARESGVTIAAAGWAHGVPEIQMYMRTHCDAYLSTVEAFHTYVMSRTQ